MSKFFNLFMCFLLPFFSLGAEARLDRLVDYDQQTCAEILQAADLSDLWNFFLKGQTDLFFSHEAQLLADEKGWRTAQSVLELGSGSGAYLSRLSETFQDKKYLGIEKQFSFVEQSNAQFGRSGLVFVEGDAEEENELYKNQFDAVLFRLTLQHLENPRLALQLAHHYLRQDGYVMIIDAYDPARSSSHEIPSVENASRQHNEQKKATHTGNRRITIEILEDLQNENHWLSNLYEVVRTNLDVQGNLLEKGIRFESEHDRKRYFNHALLLLGIIIKEYDVHK